MHKNTHAENKYECEYENAKEYKSSGHSLVKLQNPQKICLLTQLKLHYPQFCVFNFTVAPNIWGTTLRKNKNIKEERTLKEFYRQTDRHISSVLPHHSMASFGRERDWIWDWLCFLFMGKKILALSLCRLQSHYADIHAIYSPAW